MQITNSTLQALRTGFKTEFQTGIDTVTPYWGKVAKEVPSTTLFNTYGWLDGLPGMREFIGRRQLNNLKDRSYTIANKEWEDTVAVKRTHVEDDNLGMYTLAFQSLGEAAGTHVDQLVWDALLAGFADTFDRKYGYAWDGQYFFDTDHLTWDKHGNETTFSNDGGGSGAAWFLMDVSKILRPMIYQNRSAVEFVAKDRADDDSVFYDNEYHYGVYARYNVGYGLFQLAYGSRDTLSLESVVEGRTALLTGQRKPDGSKMAIMPNTIVCGPSNVGEALKIANNESKANGETNEWKGQFKVLEVPYL